MFRASSRPLSPREVLAQGQTFVPGLGLATVYRNIRRLLEEGWLVEVPLPGSPSRYELADRPHHHHFHCRSCDRVFDLEVCGIAFDRVVSAGYRVEQHDLTLSGRCPHCQTPS